MQAQVSKVRDAMDNIKSKGATATTEMKQVISDADQKQGEQLTNIKSMISNMTKMDKLETAVKNLENDINTLAGTAGTGTNPSAQEFVPGAPAAAPPGAPTVGGYTYGRSRKTGKGRRKRTKKSRRKRSGKK